METARLPRSALCFSGQCAGTILLWKSVPAAGFVAWELRAQLVCQWGERGDSVPAPEAASQRGR